VPKHVCGAWLEDINTRAMMHVLRLGRFAKGRCKATAIKTKRGVWRCPLHGGLSTGPKTAEGKAKISEAARARWAAYREAKGSHESQQVSALRTTGELAGSE
jgi:hypothetical protein